METEEIIFWDWPAKRQPFKAIVSALTVLFGIGVAAAVHWLLGVAATMLMLSALGEVLLPTRYRFDSGGFSMHGLHVGTSKTWDQIQSCKPFDDGVVLFGKKTGLRSFRRYKWSIRCRKQRETVVDIIESRIARDKKDGADR